MFSCQLGITQEGFMKSIDPGTDLSYGQCIIEYNQDTLIGLSNCFINDQGWTFYKMCFTMFNKEGDVLRNDICSDSIFMHNDFHNDLFRSGDNIIAYSTGSNSKEYWLIYNPKTGEIVCSYDEMNPEDLVVSMPSFTQLNDTTFAALYNDYNEPYTGGIGVFDNQILRNFITIEPSSDYNLVNIKIVDTHNNTLIVGGVVQEDEPGLILRKPFFEEYSLDGDLLWEYDLPDTYDNYHVKAILPLENGEEFIATFFYSTFVQGQGDEPRVMKISKSEGVIWDIPFGYRLESGSGYNSLNNIHIANDGDGYIVGGSVYVHDSIWHQTAIIGKVSHAGDSLWMRSYAYATTFNASNSIDDLEPTSDGGYVGIGSQSYGSADSTPDTVARRRVLLIKTDEDGYISPPSDTEELLSTDFSVSIFPNPVSDILTLYQAEPEQLHYQIVDESGRLLHAFENSYASHYTLHDVSGYPEGTYYLLINDEAGSVESIGFVVCH